MISCQVLCAEPWSQASKTPDKLPRRWRTMVWSWTI